MSYLNARFNNAFPSSNLVEAGITLHMWDGTESEAGKWHGCPHHKGSIFKEGHGCIAFGDRFSASIVSRRKSPIFGGGGGVIFRPEFNRLLCAYGGDGGTKAGGSNGCGHAFCDPAVGAHDGWCNGAPHRPQDLKNMLQWWVKHGSSYNEVIVDVAYYEERLPHSVAAILYDGPTHRQFLRTYGVSAHDYPLVGFSPGSAYPFYRK